MAIGMNKDLLPCVGESTILIKSQHFYRMLALKRKQSLSLAKKETKLHRKIEYIVTEFLFHSLYIL